MGAEDKTKKQEKNINEITLRAVERNNEGK